MLFEFNKQGYAHVRMALAVTFNDRSRKNSSIHNTNRAVYLVYIHSDITYASRCVKSLWS